MMTSGSPNIEPERLNVMIYRILLEEKKYLKTKTKNRDDILKTIERIITDEAKKMR